MFGTLAAAILLKGGDSVVRYSLDKSSVELLYLPIPPEIKLQAKSAIDTFIWRLGDGLAGFTLAIFTDQLQWSARRVSLVNFVFIGGWITAAVVARRRYAGTLLESLRQRRLDAERQLAPILDKSTADILATQLASPDPKQVLYALEIFGASQHPPAHPGVRDLLHHESPDVRRRALELLDAAGDLWVLPRVEELLRDPDGNVRSAALLFLDHHAPADPLTRIQKLEDYQDVSVASGIVTFLARSGDGERLPEARIVMDRMIAERGEAGKSARLEAAALLSIVGEHFDDQLDALLADEDPEVVRAAVRAAGKLRKRRVAPALIGLLGDARVRDEAAQALVAMGDRILGALRDQLTDGNAALAGRLEIPAVLARIGGSGAASALEENLLESEPELRFRTICALNDLRKDQPAAAIDPVRLRAALGFEMMLHCRTNQILAVAGHGRVAVPGAAPPTEVLRRLEENQEQEIERIFRLLSLLLSGHRLSQCPLRPAVERRHRARPCHRVPRARPRPRHAQDPRSAARPGRVSRRARPPDPDAHGARDADGGRARRGARRERRSVAQGLRPLLRRLARPDRLRGTGRRLPRRRGRAAARGGPGGEEAACRGGQGTSSDPLTGPRVYGAGASSVYVYRTLSSPRSAMSLSRCSTSRARRLKSASSS